MPEEEKSQWLKVIDDINQIPVPGWIKNNILAALGKGIGKLIISGLDVPTALFEGKAKELRNKAEGNALVQKEAASQVANTFKSDSELVSRATQYFAENIIEKQINRENIAQKFLLELPNQPKDSGTQATIDEDWLTTFWNIAETKTGEEIQQILAKLLAKEVTKPKSISPVTLQLLTVLTSDVGIIFNKICNLSIDDGGSAYVVHPKHEPKHKYGSLSEYDISMADQAELENMGLIRSMNTILLHIIPSEADFIEGDYAGKEILFNFSKGVNLIQFTRAGRELRGLLNLEPNERYIKFLLKLGPNAFRFLEK